MATQSAIEWTEVTWNPTTGCDRVSAGCDNCYALDAGEAAQGDGRRQVSERRRSAHVAGPASASPSTRTRSTQPYRWRGRGSCSSTR